MAMIPVILWANWELFTPFIAKNVPNPFEPALFISHRVPGSPDSAPKYAKGYLDLVFIAYYIIVWSCVRQTITIHICYPIARYFGIKKTAKLDRFGEQGYAMIYFAFFGTWGVVRISNSSHQPEGLICA
jgi:very-long-chain ceramide synthase